MDPKLVGIVAPVVPDRFFIPGSAICTFDGKLLDQRQIRQQRDNQFAEQFIHLDVGRDKWRRFGALVERCSKVGTVDEPAGFASEYRSEEHTSEIQSLMRNTYAVYTLKPKKKNKKTEVK